MTKANDIALIILENQIALTNQIQTACLPSITSSVVAGSTALVAGWGVTYNYTFAQNPHPIYPNILKNLKIGILPYTECNYTYSLTRNLTITDSLQICAGKFNKLLFHDIVLIVITPNNLKFSYLIFAKRNLK